MKGTFESRLLNPKESKPVEVEEPTFAPQINTISSVLAKQNQQNKEDGKTGKRWEQLYEMGEKKKQELEEKRKQNKEEQEKKEQYSFHPELVTKKVPRVGSPTAGGKNSVAAVQERGSAWVKSKEGKLKALKEEEERRKVNECTFKPYLAASSTSHMILDRNAGAASTSDLESNIASLKSVDKYIEKQKAMRDTKEENKKKAEMYPGSGSI